VSEFEQAVATVLAEHYWNETRGDSGDRGGKWWRCSCGHEENVAGMSGYPSWRTAHNAHVAAALAPLLAAERARALDEAADEMDAQALGGSWASEWLRASADRERGEATT
jgi:hypothetical protein